MRIAVIGLGCLLAAGCSTTAFKDQATQLGTDASALASALPPKPSAGVDQIIDLKTDLVLGYFPVTFSADCSDNALKAYQTFLGSLPQDQAAQDQAYTALMKIAACDVVPLVPQPAAALKTAAQPNAAVPTKPEPGEHQLSADEQSVELAAQRIQAAYDARAAQQKVVGKAAKPEATQSLCGGNGSCSLDDYAKQIKAYGDAINTAGSAQSVTDAQKALGDADTALDSLTKLATTNPLAAPITDAVAAVGKLGLQQAQYEAMRRSVLLFDANWPKVAPAVEAAARTRQALLVSYAADSSEESGIAAQQYLNSDKYYHSPAERLQLFEILDARVTAAAAALKAAEVDPAAAITAFTKANHDLALAMDQNKGEGSVLQDDLKALEEQVTAIQKAAKPAATTSTKSTSGGNNGK